MKFRTASLILAASALVLSASLAAAQGMKEIPKPSDRRVGELEGWNDKPKPAAKETKKEKKPVATAAKGGKPAKAEKSESGAPDGGLPLPTGRNDPNDYAPVGFDKDGKFGTGMKF